MHKIIDRQFQYTSPFIQTLLIIYTFGFVIPYIIHIYIGGRMREVNLPNWVVVVQFTCFILCGATQVFFLSLEAAEMKYSGIVNYFQDGWNYIDSTQALFYLLQFFIKT